MTFVLIATIMAVVVTFFSMYWYFSGWISSIYSSLAEKIERLDTISKREVADVGVSVRHLREDMNSRDILGQETIRHLTDRISAMEKPKKQIRIVKASKDKIYMFGKDGYLYTPRDGEWRWLTKDQAEAKAGLK